MTTFLKNKCSVWEWHAFIRFECIIYFWSSLCLLTWFETPMLIFFLGFCVDIESVHSLSFSLFCMHHCLIHTCLLCLSVTLRSCLEVKNHSWLLEFHNFHYVFKTTDKIFFPPFNLKYLYNLKTFWILFPERIWKLDLLTSVLTRMFFQFLIFFECKFFLDYNCKWFWLLCKTTRTPSSICFLSLSFDSEKWL